MDTSYDTNSLPDLLPLYYKRLFPYDLFYRWLSYSNLEKTTFPNREFSFTLKDDVYIRFQSFNDKGEMAKEIQRACPFKIDIGAVYNMKPKEQKIRTSAFQPMEREIVFDIDMTDYDDVRFCCSGADICSKCWPLMQIAVKVISRALTEDFGLDHFIWVYSGRRGVHCWIADGRERVFSPQQRSAIVEYLSLVKGGEQTIRKVQLACPVHVSVRKSLSIINDYVDSYLFMSQDFLGTDQRVETVLSLVNHVIPENDRQNVKEIVLTAGNSRQRWSALKQIASSRFKELKLALDEVLLQFCYPRLDVNVSKELNHLLKTPYSVHPKTGRVCVPFNYSQVDHFDPFSVPTISGLLNEISSAVPAEAAKENRQFYGDLTGLKSSLDCFEHFVVALEKDATKKRRQLTEKQVDF